MKTVNLGSFETKGKLLVTDPCYTFEQSASCIIPLDVLAGTYESFITYGRLKEPLFFWDTIPVNFRTAELEIRHQLAPENLNWTQLFTSICVDSGQAGFFNADTYQIKFACPQELVNHQSSFYREQISTAMAQIKRYEEAMKDKDQNDLFKRMKDHFSTKETSTDPETKTLEYFTSQKQMSEWDLTDSIKVLATKKYPAYIKTKHSTDFYDFVCDMTSSEDNAGVNYVIGAASRTGIGDGSYKLSVANNEQGQVVAAKINYLKLNELQEENYGS